MAANRIFYFNLSRQEFDHITPEMVVSHCFNIYVTSYFFTDQSPEHTASIVRSIPSHRCDHLSRGAYVACAQSCAQRMQVRNMQCNNLHVCLNYSVFSQHFLSGALSNTGHHQPSNYYHTWCFVCCHCGAAHLHVLR